MKALEEVYAQTMTTDMGYDYLGMSFMEKQAQESIARMEKKGAKFSVIDKKPFVERIAKLYGRMENEGKMPKGLLAEIQALAKK